MVTHDTTYQQMWLMRAAIVCGDEDMGSRQLPSCFLEPKHQKYPISPNAALNNAALLLHPHQLHSSPSPQAIYIPPPIPFHPDANITKSINPSSTAFPAWFQRYLPAWIGKVNG